MFTKSLRLLKRFTWKHTLNFHPKKPPPPGVFIFGWSPNEQPRRRGPLPETQLQFFKWNVWKETVCFRFWIAILVIISSHEFAGSGCSCKRRYDTWKLTISKKIKTNKLVDHFKNKLTEWLTSQCSSWGRRKKSISSESTTPLWAFCCAWLERVRDKWYRREEREEKEKREKEMVGKDEKGAEERGRGQDA